MYLLKTLSQIQTAIYLKNQSPSINGVTLYKLGNYVRLDLSYLKVVGFQVWIHIPKEKKGKLDIRSWQGIFLRYKDTNQYYVYNSLTRKVHITQDLFVNKQHLYL